MGYLSGGEEVGVILVEVVEANLGVEVEVLPEVVVVVEYPEGVEGVECPEEEALLGEGVAYFGEVVAVEGVAVQFLGVEVL